MHFDFPDQSESQKKITASANSIFAGVGNKPVEKIAKKVIAKVFTVWCQNENGEVYSENISGDSAADAKKRAENKGKNVIDVEEASPMAASKRQVVNASKKQAGNFAWDYFYLKDSKIVDETGREIFPEAPSFETPEDAEQWLVDQDERGNMVGKWEEHKRPTGGSKKTADAASKRTANARLDAFLEEIAEDYANELLEDSLSYTENDIDEYINSDIWYSGVELPGIGTQEDLDEASEKLKQLIIRKLTHKASKRKAGDDGVNSIVQRIVNDYAGEDLSDVLIDPEVLDSYSVHFDDYEAVFNALKERGFSIDASKKTAAIEKQPFDVRPTSWHVDSEATGGIHLMKTEEE